MIFHWIRASIAKEPYSFVVFQGGGVADPSPPSPLDPRMSDPVVDGASFVFAPIVCGILVL